ncbi:MAG: hypothetical protein WC867_03165 [Candidatus Pacearchaeota archaeon]|jgi:hypothetical protein
MSQIRTIPTIKEILEFGEVKLLECPKGGGGMTKEVHLAILDNQKYILRRCNSSENLERYKKYSLALSNSGIIPTMYEIDGRDILYEFIEGRDLSYEDKNQARKIGRMQAIVNQIPNDIVKDVDGSFFNGAIYLVENKVISEEEFKTACHRYANYRPEKIEIVSELTDSIPRNFRMDNNCDTYLVDIDAIWHLTKGRGFAKAYLKWFTCPDSRKEFLEGYKEVADPSFFTDEYKQFLYLSFIVAKMHDWHKRGTNYEKFLNWFKQTLEGKLE